MTCILTIFISLYMDPESCPRTTTPYKKFCKGGF
jgi:hypothetical protein